MSETPTVPIQPTTRRDVLILRTNIANDLDDDLCDMRGSDYDRYHSHNNYSNYGGYQSHDDFLDEQDDYDMMDDDFWVILNELWKWLLMT